MNDKLFACYIGGSTATSLIELHDARFVIAPSIEESYDALRASWWGTPESLHLDCWGELTAADGHRVTLSPAPPPADMPKLYFINLGGYMPGAFDEAHKNVFVVAPDLAKAKVKALRMIRDWGSHHVDRMVEVEQAYCVNDAARAKSLYLHLTPEPGLADFSFTSRYQPLT